MEQFLEISKYLLNLPLFPVGHTTVTLAMLLYLALLITLLVSFAKSFRQKALEKLLRKSNLDPALQHNLAMVCQYAIVGIGTVIILNTCGIEMTALTVVAGALGIGLSLGLQNLAKNVAGGIMILIERPIKIGDRVQIGNTTGDVIQIALRSTTIRTDDHIDIIVPNSDFMDQRVCNWTYSSKDVIIGIPIVVSTENDLLQVQEILQAAACAHDKVIDDPKPEVVFESFEGGKLRFLLRVASSDYVYAANKLRSDLNTEIYRQFKAQQIKLAS